MIAISSTFCSIFLTLTDFTLHFSRCFTTLLHSDFILLLNSFYTAGKVFTETLYIDGSFMKVWRFLRRKYIRERYGK